MGIIPTLIANQRQRGFKNLVANTFYYFKIYSFAGTGAAINYKTDGGMQEVAVRTGL